MEKIIENLSSHTTGSDIMGNNAGNVEDTLKERGNIYGKYSDVLDARAKILDILGDHYHAVNNNGMSMKNKVAFGDLVLKLVRAAGAPGYADSFHDLGGYAKLMEDIANEKDS